jgi:hypothetical protein
MIFSLRPEGIGEYTPEERHNVPWISRFAYVRHR